MMNGESSVLIPTHDSNVESPDSKGFTPITYPPDGPILLTTPAPVEITSFELEAIMVCKEGNPLTIEVTYYNENNEPYTVSGFFLVFFFAKSMSN